MSERGQLRVGNVSQSDVPAFINNKFLMHHCLDCARMCDVADDLKILSDRKNQEGKRTTAANNIATKVFEKIADWEEKKTTDQRKFNKTFLGLGKRIGKYRKRIADAKGKKKPGSVSLVELNVLLDIESQQQSKKKN